MKLDDAVNNFYDNLMSYCSPATLEYYFINLKMFSDWIYKVKFDSQVRLEDISREDYAAYIKYNRGRVSNTSVRTYARAMKVFFRYCYDEGFIAMDITKKVKLPRADDRVKMPLTQAQVEKIKNELRYDYRNLAIFFLMLDCGLRLSEVINLELDDLDFDNNYVVIRNSKYNKSRLVPMSEDVNMYLHEYLSYYRKRWSPISAVFLTRTNTKLTKDAVECMFNKLKSDGCNVYPHLLRHTFATSFVLGGGSLEVLRVLMGHSDYNVTKEYLHIASQLKVADYDIYKLDDVFFKTYNYRK